MKILAFSDVHCSVQACEDIVRLSAAADVVVGAGDFATARRGLESVIQSLSVIEKPTVVVPGNSESFDELKSACADWPHAHVLHGSSCEIGGIPFYGLGGGIPVTPFGDWSYDFSEKDAKQLLANCPSGGVLVTHSPPKGILDLSSRGKSLGSTAILDSVQELAPRLVVCGHIHDSSGKSVVVGQTTVINAGPMGMIFELETSQ